jgi:DNA-binding CsgD family transcriptional regulator
MTSEMPDLTPQEGQVLALVVQGRTNSQIRAELGLSVHALSIHLHSLYRKSGIHRPSQPYPPPTDLRRRLAEWGRRYFPNFGG